MKKLWLAIGGGAVLGLAVWGGCSSDETGGGGAGASTTAETTSPSSASSGSSSSSSAGSGGSAGDGSGGMNAGGAAPGCDAPAVAPSKGACVTLTSAGAGGSGGGGGGMGPGGGGGGEPVPTIECNPVTNEPCPAGAACDALGPGFTCYPDGNVGTLCGPCDIDNGQFCQGTLTCINSVCIRYCCTDEDCGTGTCTKTDLGDPLFPSAPDLGRCSGN